MQDTELWRWLQVPMGGGLVKRMRCPTPAEYEDWKIARNKAIGKWVEENRAEVEAYVAAVEAEIAGEGADADRVWREKVLCKDTVQRLRSFEAFLNSIHHDNPAAVSTAMAFRDVRGMTTTGEEIRKGYFDPMEESDRIVPPFPYHSLILKVSESDEDDVETETEDDSAPCSQDRSKKRARVDRCNLCFSSRHELVRCFRVAGGAVQQTKSFRCIDRDPASSKRVRCSIICKHCERPVSSFTEDTEKCPDCVGSALDKSACGRCRGVGTVWTGTGYCSLPDCSGTKSRVEAECQRLRAGIEARQAKLAKLMDK